MLTVAFLVAAILNCSALTSSDLVGLWESEQVSKGGIGHTLEFKPDASYIESTTVIVDMRYLFEGGKLFVFQPQASPDTSKDSGAEVVFEGKNHVVKGADGSIVRKESLEAKQSSSSIVGACRYRHYTGAIAFERYTPDGLLQFRLPMTSSSGCYSVEKDRINLIQNNKKTAIPFKLIGGQLSLENANKPPSRYRKETVGAWYPRDMIDYQPPENMNKQ
jgi:hypothetical protein